MRERCRWSMLLGRAETGKIRKIAFGNLKLIVNFRIFFSTQAFNVVFRKALADTGSFVFNKPVTVCPAYTNDSPKSPLHIFFIVIK